MENPARDVAMLLIRLARAYDFDDEALDGRDLFHQLHELAGMLTGELRLDVDGFVEDWRLCPHGRSWFDVDCKEKCPEYSSSEEQEQ